MMNKKGEVAEGFTWFFSFIIIFMIIAGFLMVSVYYSAKKTVVPSDLSLTSDKNELIVGKNTEVKSNDFETYDRLIGFLNSYSKSGDAFLIDMLKSNSISFNDSIASSIKLEAKAYFDKLEGSNCYYICIFNYNSNKIRDVIEADGNSCQFKELCSYSSSLFNTDNFKKSIFNQSNGETGFYMVIYEENKK